MDAIESRVRLMLAEAFPRSASKPLPHRTRSQVRFRQGRSLAAVALGAVLLTAGAAAAWSSLPTPRPVVPASRIGNTSLTPSVPAGSYGPWPTVELGGPQAPYVDHQGGDGRVLLTPKTVVAYGTVAGIPWSAAGYQLGPPAGGGACMDVFVGVYVEPGTTPGGGAVCQHRTIPPDPRDDVFVLAGAMSGTGMEGVETYSGAVGRSVATVVVELADGTSRPVDIITGPPGVSADFFVFFPPSGAFGRVVAEDRDGHVVGTAALCPVSADVCPGT